MSAFEDQWPAAAMPECSPMDDEMEYQSIVSTSLSSPMDCGSEYERTSFAEDGYEYQPTSSEEDGSQFYPSSSKEDESDSEPPQPHKNNNDIHMHQTCVTLNHHHLRSDTELEVGSVISKGQTWELHDGSFLMITELGRSSNSLSVEFFGHLFRPIEEFRDYLPVKFSGSELVWLCEAKEHESKPRSYLRSACSRDVLRIRQLVLINSECSPQPFTDPRTLVCQWKLVAELSRYHATSGPRGCKSFESGSLGQPKAFAELSSQDLLTGGNLTADKFHSQHHLHSDPPEASSDDGPSQPPKKHGLATYRNLGTSKERCQDISRSLLLAPSTNGNRIAKATRSPGKSPCHLEIKLACMLALSSTQRTVSEQSIEPQIYTFADAFCGAGGMSVGAKAAALRIEWAFDEDKDAIDTYSWNHGKDTCKKMSAESFLEAVNVFETSKVHILHLSPPCQGFSLACRGTPRNGEQDNECMTYVGEIVKKVKPRIVTFEEVPQVLFRHRQHFTATVLSLTSLGYNVGWRVLECADFGVPQRRKRLFMVASCRGQPLPDFPKPTHAHSEHCEELGLQPWNYFGGAIDDLEDNAPNHLPQKPRKERRIDKQKPGQRPDWPLHGTITTGQNWPDHYSGKCLCTVREAACLQSFPADYTFCGTLPATKKQVANAVPPLAAKAILEEVKRSLMRTDALRRS